jgi:hypothetical protein
VKRRKHTSVYVAEETHRDISHEKALRYVETGERVTFDQLIREGLRALRAERERAA